MSSAAALWQHCSSQERAGNVTCVSSASQNYFKDGSQTKHVTDTFHKPPIYFCHQISAEQQLSWPRRKGGKVGEGHICTPHSHLLTCLGTFSWGRTGPFSQETATSWSQGNSRVKEVKKFQWGQWNSATSCPKNTQGLQSDTAWKLPWTMLQARGRGPALPWAGGGSRWHLESLPKKIGIKV